MGMYISSNAHLCEPGPAPVRLLKLRQVEEMVNLKKTTIYKLMKQGQFPLCLKAPGSGASRWLYSEIFEWLQNLKH